MKKLYHFLFTLLIILNYSPKSTAQAFIRVTGNHFMYQGKPYYFAGVNMWYAAYLGAIPEGRERLIRELDTLKAIGITNIRIAGGTERSDLNRSISRAIQTEPGVYDEGLLEGLDFALAEMGKRGMHAVIFLTNFWPWSGGMAQYVSWVTGTKIPDPNVGTDWREWQKFMDYSASFYTNEKANELFRNHIHFMINRMNTFTGVCYKDDPAIMAWELANEPRPCPDVPIREVNIPAFIRWAHETAAYIHSLDTNHLVTTGTEGKVGCFHKEEIFLQLHDSKYIDYANLHLWPRNWQWFNCRDIDGTLQQSIERANEYVNLHTDMALKLGKPITLEEFGMERDSCKAMPGSAVTARDAFLSAMFDKAYANAKEGGSLAGTNVWAWGGFGKPHRIDEVIDNAGAYVGDPLEEMQGLNSVYASDTTTIQIMKKHAAEMKSLCRAPEVLHK